MMGDEATGLPKYNVKLNSLALPILKLIAEVIDPENFKKNFKKAKKNVIYEYLSDKNEYDACSFGCILLDTVEDKVALLVPVDKPYKYNPNTGVFYKFKNLVEDTSNIPEDDLKSEFWVMDSERLINEDYGSETTLTKKFVKHVLANKESYPQLHVSLLCRKTRPKAEPKIKFNMPSVGANNERNGNIEDSRTKPVLKTSTPYPNLTRNLIDSRIPRPVLDDSEEDQVDLMNLEEGLRRSRNQHNKSGTFNSGLNNESTYEFISVKEQAKIKVTLKTLGFENLRDIKIWMNDSVFSLDIAGVTDERLRVSQMLSNMNDNLKNVVIRKLSRNNV